MKHSAITLSLLAFAFSANAWAGSCKQESDRFVNDGGGCIDRKTGLVWSDAPGLTVDYTTAASFCASLDRPPFVGWRQPTYDEFTGIASTGQAASINWKGPNRFFWTWSAAASDRAMAVMPSLQDGVDADEAFELKKEFRAGTICVRRVTGCATESGAFRSAYGGCYQTATKLAWGKPASEPMDFEMTASFCRSQSEGSYSDWRAPTVAELKGLAGSNKATAHLGFNTNTVFWAGVPQIIMQHEVPPSYYHYNVSKINLATGQEQKTFWGGTMRPDVENPLFTEGPFPVGQANVICVRTAEK